MVGKGEIACKEQFLLFPQCFLLNQIIVSPFVHIFYLLSLFAAELEKPKIGISGRVKMCFWYLILTLVPNKEGLTTRNTHVKYEKFITYHLKVMAKVRAFCRQTNSQGKN